MSADALTFTRGTDGRLYADHFPPRIVVTDAILWDIRDGVRAFKWAEAAFDGRRLTFHCANGMATYTLAGDLTEREIPFTLTSKDGPHG